MLAEALELTMELMSAAALAQERGSLSELAKEDSLELALAPVLVDSLELETAFVSAPKLAPPSEEA